MTYHILIPQKDGHGLHKTVLHGLSIQDVDFKVISISRPSDRHPPIIGGSEAECRNLLKEYASDPYTFYMDSDVECTSSHDLSDCITFLDSHTEWDAVVLDTKTRIQKPNVIIAFMCIRKTVLDTYTFMATNRECCCRDVDKKLRVRYLDDRFLREVPR
jgi:hypothetical protein